MNILVSACLLGCKCRYDGDHNWVEAVSELERNHRLIPICPEELGGLPTPRTPAEIQQGRVVDKSGADVTDEFQKGAVLALELARKWACQLAILKERSPSCGVHQIYDGTFSKKLVAGHGMTAKLLLENGILVIGESQVGELPAIMERLQKTTQS
ncbi:MAG: DUF523 domain-containing protein [Turicibacter sp.]|nr:DUF523 domain-containing protein [Turicibacter sp.]